MKNQTATAPKSTKTILQRVLEVEFEVRPHRPQLRKRSLPCCISFQTDLAIGHVVSMLLRAGAGLTDAERVELGIQVRSMVIDPQPVSGVTFIYFSRVDFGIDFAGR